MLLASDRDVGFEGRPLAVGKLRDIKPGGGHGQLMVSSMKDGSKGGSEASDTGFGDAV